VLGHSGRTETIEWAVYMSMLVGFPVTCIVVAILLPRVFKGTLSAIVKAFVVLATLAFALKFALDGRLSLALIAMIPAAVTALTSVATMRIVAERPTEGIVALLMLFVVAMLAWMSAGGMVYWDRATSWFLGSPVRFVAVAVSTAIAIIGLPRLGDRVDVKAAPGVAFRIVSIFVLLSLIVFSFRTNPVWESYHWEFWTGPIEQLRQGGWLLRDTPFQYGFLSIIVPTFMPGKAWISFWYYQAVIYALVAVMMFLVMRQLRDGVGNLLLATTVVFTTLFFRPRTATLILAAQMTPSGGPVRFLWCYVLLGWLLTVFLSRRSAPNETIESWTHPRGGFPIVGHVIWLCSVAWSFEAATYSSAIWFSAFAVYLLQRAATERSRGASLASIATNALASLVLPFTMVTALYLVVFVFYRIAGQGAPDLHGYIEYGLLYSRGFGSLPISTTGPIWYLVLVFAAVSTAVVRFLVEDWRDFRLVLASGVWGGTWSLSSYYVSRSHPVNLLSIIPVLLFGLAIMMTVIRHSTRRDWHGYMRAAAVPLLAIPMAMTLGHPDLGRNLSTPQLAPHDFVMQIPAMDMSLQRALIQVGAKPTDSFVRIVDGRLSLPPWHGRDGGLIMSERSWLPKPYEIIGSLDAPRRQVYLDRNPGGGWLVHHTSDTIPHFDDRLAEILRGRRIDFERTIGAWKIYKIQKAER
jgi:hypothetical protein